MQSKLTLLLCSIAVAALGCSSESGGAGGETFPADPYVTLRSDANGLAIEVRTAPDQPPSRGAIDVELVIKGEGGEGLDDLALEVSPWMPAMGHGTSTKPVVEAKGQGHYLVSKVGLFMAGAWQLKTKLSGPLEDSATIELQIP